MAELEGVDIFVLTEEEFAQAVKATLDWAGVASYEDLEAQARSRRFSSQRASDAWFAIPPGAGRR
ncbi:MAG: hypothetical protein OXH20_01245 [bacterium]|nr:hypothetical protein [bacterium]MXZ30124.1 hypothetical protein [Acidimicrobiia bacterium]MYJ13402.1 hypothetical protein [Acidimicrobiia bacterium]